MTLSIVDPAVLTPLVVEGWKKYLYSDKGLPTKEPTLGPNFDNVTEGLVETVYDYNNVSVTRTELVSIAVVCDNRNGLLKPFEQDFQYQYTNEQGMSHSSSSAFSHGVSENIKVSGKVFGIGAESDTNFDFNYSSSTDDAQTTTETTSSASKTSWTMSAPAGKRYQACLFAKACTLNVPFTSSVVLKGRPSISFDGTSNDSEIGNAIYYFQTDTVKSCGVDNNDAIVHGMTGVVYGSKGLNFTLVMLDITNSTPLDHGMPLPDQAVVIATQSV